MNRLELHQKRVELERCFRLPAVEPSDIPRTMTKEQKREMDRRDWMLDNVVGPTLAESDVELTEGEARLLRRYQERCRERTLHEQ